ncbi:hypothetical protein P153DRAFT_366632 [Dothidotthia symphoricarpi CBS 119687]|uniref:Uncharacterized protein n=1 Tax=Dothidotthia symphoricarpi CBS 119687 TaxID=1392245 RepID=A0A6A6ABN3_9PLEO|nr:uncharacterized protein P153DRAFT_366632 [Dothidotthia symphoricarpi CBS 119687]KAF2129199.1 hypothetical protein P153DRAFT_366632 [Dothidotthia symphoricarpi CBS 119687]
MFSIRPLATLLLSAASAIPSVAALPVGATNLTTVSVYADVPGPKNLENLVVRRNGDMLVTSITSPSIFLISPDNTKAPVAVADVPNTVGLLGIVELEENVFYVVASNETSGPDSNEVWKLNMQQGCTAQNGSAAASGDLSLTARIPTAKQLNGLIRLADNDTTNVLISDSSAGTITRLNVETGAYEVVIEDERFLPTSSGIGVGLDGIRMFEDQLYFTSLDQGFFGSVPISLSTGTATGPIDIIVNGTLLDADDFALSSDGSKAYIAENGQNVIVEVDISSKTNRVLVNNTLLGRTSSVYLGQTRSDSDSLYVTGAKLSANGTAIEGRVLKVALY